MNYEYKSINDIYKRLEEIVNNSQNEPLDILGGYVVGCTIVLDNIHEYYDKYPILEGIAELGAELETIDDLEYQVQLLNEIKSKTLELKNTITNI